MPSGRAIVPGPPPSLPCLALSLLPLQLPDQSEQLWPTHDCLASWPCWTLHREIRVDKGWSQDMWRRGLGKSRSGGWGTFTPKLNVEFWHPEDRFNFAELREALNSFSGKLLRLRLPVVRGYEKTPKSFPTPTTFSVIVLMWPSASAGHCPLQFSWPP